jgi:hypothetical protein
LFRLNCRRESNPFVCCDQRWRKKERKKEVMMYKNTYKIEDNMLVGIMFIQYNRHSLKSAVTIGPTTAEADEAAPPRKAPITEEDNPI